MQPYFIDLSQSTRWQVLSGFDCDKLTPFSEKNIGRTHTYVKVLTHIDNMYTISVMELLTEKEKQILASLFKNGSSPISKIAKDTLINRTALYHTFDLLIKKGLINKSIRENTSYFAPLPLPEFREWLKKQKSQLEKETDSLSQWSKNVKQNSGDNLQTEIKYYSGIEGMEYLYADGLRDNPGKEILAITDYDKAYTEFKGFFENEYFPTRVKKGIHVKSIVSEDSPAGKKDISRKQDLLRQMKFANIFKDLGIELNIYNDKVSIISLDKKNPTGIILKNKIINNAFREIFNFIWKNSKSR